MNLTPNLCLWDLKAASAARLLPQEGRGAGTRVERLPKENETHPLGLLSFSVQHASGRVPGPVVKRSP